MSLDPLQQLDPKPVNGRLQAILKPTRVAMPSIPETEEELELNASLQTDDKDNVEEFWQRRTSKKSSAKYLSIQNIAPNFLENLSLPMAFKNGSRNVMNGQRFHIKNTCTIDNALIILFFRCSRIQFNY